jgi:hypothetical protein
LSQISPLEATNLSDSHTPVFSPFHRIYINSNEHATTQFYLTIKIQIHLKPLDKGTYNTKTLSILTLPNVSQYRHVDKLHHKASTKTTQYSIPLLIPRIYLPYGTKLHIFSKCCGVEIKQHTLTQKQQIEQIGNILFLLQTTPSSLRIQGKQPLLLLLY